MRKLYFVAALTLISPMAVAAQPPSADVPVSKPDEVTVIGQQPEGSKLVCERFVPTGSMKTERICLTQAEFDRIRQDSMVEVERLLDEQFRNRQWGINCQFMGMC